MYVPACCITSSRSPPLRLFVPCTSSDMNSRSRTRRERCLACPGTPLRKNQLRALVFGGHQGDCMWRSDHTHDSRPAGRASRREGGAQRDGRLPHEFHRRGEPRHAGSRCGGVDGAASIGTERWGGLARTCYILGFCTSWLIDKLVCAQDLVRGVNFMAENVSYSPSESLYVTVDWDSSYEDSTRPSSAVQRAAWCVFSVFHLGALICGRGRQ